MLVVIFLLLLKRVISLFVASQCCSVVKRLESIEEEVIQSDKHLSSVQQARCLRGLVLFNRLDNKSLTGPAAFNIKEPSKSNKAPGGMVGMRAAPSEPARQEAAKRDQTKDSTSEKTTPNSTTRKIRRPTNILKPTLIGKSVDGSAMQALAASRARASARTMPGQLRASSAVTGRASTKPHRERQPSTTPSKSAPKASAKARKDTTPVRKEAIGQNKAIAARPSAEVVQIATNSKIEAIPARFLEFYSRLQTMCSSAVLKRRIPVFVSQQLVSKFMLYIQQHKSTADAEMRFMLTHATPFFSSSCEISQCGKDQVVPFLMSFAQSVVKRNRNGTILSVDRRDEPVLYVRQDLAGSRSCKAILILELTAIKHSVTQQFIARCCCWLFIQSPERTIAAGTKARGRSRRFKSKRSPNMALTKREKTSSALHSLATYYCVSALQYTSFLFGLLHDAYSCGGFLPH